MLKKRLIPVILLRNGVIVQSRKFKRYNVLGSPTAAVERLSSWSSDELIYLDISTNNFYDLGRDDLNHPGYSTFSEIVKLISKKCHMPLTLGGGIRTIDQVVERVQQGADKITLNTMAVQDPDFISVVAKEVGSQCIVISIDIKMNNDGSYEVYERGKIPTGLNPIDFTRKVEDLGAGEILLNSIDLDGSGTGFDLELIQSIATNVSIPVIALGGAGKWEDFQEVLEETDAAAVAAANIFHHSENSVFNCKEFLFQSGMNVRKPLKLSQFQSNL